MALKVLDSWALMAFFEDEPAAEEVEKLLHQAVEEKHRLLLSVVSWGEIFYSTMRAVSFEAAGEKAGEIAALPIEIIGLSEDLSLTRQAAIFKATHRMSYADCFAAALAKSRNAELITGDLEFKAVAKEIKIGWLRRTVASDVRNKLCE
ncbi:MAG TPA: type II toxin-antitoxin system VapC family toxin [Verrucomicrobiae bacterium]|nr:type II toxin-antitoxin system VapC family toxin [Verrucomicrobiae bacterium]